MPAADAAASTIPLDEEDDARVRGPEHDAIKLENEMGQQKINYSSTNRPYTCAR